VEERMSMKGKVRKAEEKGGGKDEYKRLGKKG